MKGAIFLDRDGVINDEVELLNDESQLRIIPTVDRAIKIFNELGFYVIVITNQPQIGRGLLTETKLNRIHRLIKDRLKSKGANIDAFYYCPHHPERHHTDIKPENMKYRIDCDCRKPGIGMFERAKKEFDIDFGKSYMIGDSTCDIKAGEDSGCKTILVKTGNGGKDNKYLVSPTFIANSLVEAAEFIRNDFRRMKAVILAGGKGERLMPLTKHNPKPMLIVGSKSILHHQIELLKSIGIKDIIICGYYLFDKIKDYFGDGSKFGVNIIYCEEESMMGTGGALKNAEPYIEGTFLMLYGDTMIDMDLNKMVEFHKSKKALATVIVVPDVSHPEDSDLLDLNPDNRIIRFYKKPHKKIRSKIGKSSIFVIEKEIFKYVSKEKHSFDSDDFPRLIKGHKMYGYMIEKNEYVRDIGTMERYKKCIEEWRNRNERIADKSSYE